MTIQMVDLLGQYADIKTKIDAAIAEVLAGAAFINGPQVGQFAANLAHYLDVPHVIPCANGTDALQIALMALDLKTGDEVIVPAFTYVATAEVIGLLGLTPVMVDVDGENFTILTSALDAALSPKTKAIVPVHLFGQCANMGPLTAWAKQNNVFVVEDNAQALGAKYIEDDKSQRAGTMGAIGCTSFFPSKNLGCFGDGGALMTKDAALAERIKMIANHGQKQKYYHEVLGCNSRLDTLQAAILNVKLEYLDKYEQARYKAAQTYTQAFQALEGLVCPKEEAYSTHVYHQYTLKVPEGRRDGLKEFLAKAGIPSMIYYPLPLQQQNAFKGITRNVGALAVSERLCTEVLSLPMHTHIKPEQQNYIIDKVIRYFKH